MNNRNIMLFLFLGSILFAYGNKNNNEINETIKAQKIADSIIKKYLSKKELISIQKSEKEAHKLQQTLKPIKYDGFVFYSPQSKQVLKKIKSNFKKCIKDNKTNTGICYDIRFKNLEKLKEFDEKETYYVSNQIYNLIRKKEMILNSVLYDIPEYKQYRKLRLECMKYSNVSEVKKCFNKNKSKLLKLNKYIKVVKEKIINKINKKIKNFSKKTKKSVPTEKK